MLASLVSCNISNTHRTSATRKYALSDYTYQNINYKEVLQVFAGFQVLYCVNEYVNYTDAASRDIQWFARYGKVSDPGASLGHYMISPDTELYIFRNESVLSNGKDLFEPGASFIFCGHSYICTGENTWEITNDTTTLTVEMTERTSSSARIILGGGGHQEDEKSDINACFTVNYDIIWPFAMKPLEMDECIVGMLSVDYFSADYAIDRVQLKYSGNKNYPEYSITSLRK